MEPRMVDCLPTAKFLDLYLYGVMERDSSIQSQGFPSTVRKKELHKLVDRLDEQDQKSAHDYLRYLINRRKDPHDEIRRRDADHVPTNEEEADSRRPKTNGSNH